MRTRGQVLAERRPADLGEGALQLAPRGRHAARDVVEREVLGVLGVHDRRGVLEQAGAEADGGGSLHRDLVYAPGRAVRMTSGDESRLRRSTRSCDSLRSRRRVVQQTDQRRGARDDAGTGRDEPGGPRGRAGTHAARGGAPDGRAQGRRRRRAWTPTRPAPGSSPSATSSVRSGRTSDPDTALVGDHMSTDTVFAAPDWSLEEAAVTMVRHGFRHLVVIAGGGDRRRPVDARRRALLDGRRVELRAARRRWRCRPRPRATAGAGCAPSR